MVESTALEMRRAREGTQGSNPCLSANYCPPPFVADRNPRLFGIFCPWEFVGFRPQPTCYGGKTEVKISGRGKTMGKLTVKYVESLKEPGRYSDEDGTGFHLWIDSAGRKYWILRARMPDGARKDISLGSVSKLSLAGARGKARQRYAKIRGGDVAPTEVPTFSEAAEQAHKARTVGYRNAKHVNQWISTLQTYASPIVGAKRIDEVTTADVIAVLSPIWAEKPETARRVLQRIDRVMRWAVGNGHRKDRIDMVLVRDLLPRVVRKRSSIKRMASVDWREAPAFWANVTLSSSSPVVRMALQFLMLTAVRPGNIRTARFDQMDLENKTWTVPGDDMKVGEEFRVALSSQAVGLIQQMRSIQAGDQVFSVNDSSMSPDTLRMAVRRLGRTETPHGFRSTFKEWAMAHDWADHLSEAALAHQDPNEVRAAYARSDLLDERRPMMQKWGDYLLSSQKV